MNAKKSKSPMEQLEEKLHAATELQTRIIEALALAIEAKDHSTLDHLHRVQMYSIEIGKRLGLTEVELEALKIAALLHDIGKLAVPEHIISKPGRLTPGEFEKYKVHVVVGAEILERIEFPYPVASVVRSHHERWDGTGYPDGLRGEEIPIGARILSAVDCLDALATDRQYRRALPLDDAIQWVINQSEKAYDPQVVAMLSVSYKEIEERVQAQSKVRNRQDLLTGFEIKREKIFARGDEVNKPLESRSQAAFLSLIAAARQEAQTLFELTQDLGNSLSLSETLSVLSGRLKRLVPYDAIAAYLVRGNELLPEYVNGDNFRLFAALRIPLGEGLSGWVAQNRKSVLNGNPAVEPGYVIDSDRFTPLRSAISIPLEGLQGVIGVLTLYHSEPDAYTFDHLRILQAISSKVALSLENALAFQEAENSAITDHVTGLPNLAAFFSELERALWRNRGLQSRAYVVVVKIQGFEQMRMRYGWDRMREGLKLMASELTKLLLDSEYLARAGEEDFVLILNPVGSRSLNQRLIELTVTIQSICTSAFKGSLFAISVGSAEFPTSDVTPEELFICADRKRTMRFSVAVCSGDENQTRSLRAFLCHSSGDKDAVRKLYDRLTLDGVDAWLDEKKLIPGQNWRSEIEKAVRSTDVVIVCLSNNSVTKEGFVQKEIKFALDVAEEKPFGTIFLIPTKLTDCDVPDRLTDWQWVNLSSDTGYESLLRALSSRAEALTSRALAAKL